MKYFHCPKCNKQLIRLEFYEIGHYDYWCDDCNIDINITFNQEIEEEKSNNG